jgi:hypothetical protein
MLEQVKVAYGKVLRLEDEGYNFDELMDELDEFLEDNSNLTELYDKFLSEIELSNAECTILVAAFDVFVAEF